MKNKFPESSVQICFILNLLTLNRNVIRWDTQWHDCLFGCSIDCLLNNVLPYLLAVLDSDQWQCILLQYDCLVITLSYLTIHIYGLNRFHSLWLCSQWQHCQWKYSTIQNEIIHIIWSTTEGCHQCMANWRLILDTKMQFDIDSAFLLRPFINFHKIWSVMHTVWPLLPLLKRWCISYTWTNKSACF